MKKIIFVSLMFSSVAMLGQEDVHFSQFFMTPVNANPAASGVYAGDIRLGGVYRNQWSSIVDAYSTMGFYGDFKLFRGKIDNGYFGLGFDINKDDAGDSKFSMLQGNLALSYILEIDGDKNMLSAGLQGGYIQRSISYDALYWDEQYTGNGFNTALPTGEEAFPAQSVGVPDAGVGIHWLYRPDDLTIINAGISASHLLSPDVSFTKAAPQNLLRKFTLHFNGEFEKKNTDYAFLPAAIISFQGPNRYFNLGTEIKYFVKHKAKYTGFSEEVSFSLGPYYRFGDALYAVARFNMAGFTLGASYDFTMSDLSYSNKSLGGMEFTLMWRGNFGGGSSLKFY